MNKFTENECLPNFELNFKFLENLRKPLTLKSTRKRIEEKNKMAETREESQTTVLAEENQTSVAKENQTAINAEKGQASIPENQTIVTYTEDELASFRDNMVSKNTKKSTSTSVRRLQSWFKEKHGKQINLDAISKLEAPQLLKHFFLEIRQTTKENKGKEYEPGTLQTYRNGLRRYFLERPCPPAIDNFDLEKSSAIEFEEVSTMLSMKKKDLKQKGLGNKANAAQPVETEDIEKMWSSGAIGLQNPRSLLHLVWWSNVTHLGMRGFKEQHDCQLSDFTVTEQYIEYKERQTKNRQGDEPTATKRARKYNNKIWRTDGGERDPHRAFIEYIGHRPKGDKVPGNFYLSPVDSPKSNVWYKMVSIGRNTLAKHMQSIASIASLDGKFTNSSGRKTVIQALRDDFDPLEISELTGHANPLSISSYSHNPLEKQRQMSNKLAGFNPSTTTTNSDSSHALQELVINCSAPPSNTTATSNRDISTSRSSYLMQGALGGMFTGVTFNNSPVNISINFQSNMTPTTDSLQ